MERAQKKTSSIADDTEEEIRVQEEPSPALPSCVLICECVSPITTLREEMTMKVNARCNECARNLSNEKILAKLTARDAIAQDCN